MKKRSPKTESKAGAEPVVIADECGDSMWDAVLQQEVKVCDVKAVSTNASLLFSRIDAVQVSDTTKVQ